MASKELRINKMITVWEVRLIDDAGRQHGVIPTVDALRLATQRNLDLVEVAPQSKPPVCKLLDYGKYKFEQKKRNQESRRRQKQVKMKEIRMQPKIEFHDLEFKTKHILKFLDEGNRVKVTVRFRGRESKHTELGTNVLERVLEKLGSASHLDRSPFMEGRFMSMIVSPSSRKE